jgi:hypothetical protein
MDEKSPHDGSRNTTSKLAPPQGSGRIGIPTRVAVAVGVAYGILCQIVVRLDVLRDLYGETTFGYVFILPLVLGAITVGYASEKDQRSILFWLFAPWITTCLCLAVSIVVGWEGAICLIFAAIIACPISSVGGLFAGLYLTFRRRRYLGGFVAPLLLISPLLSAVIEEQFDLPIVNGGAETAIDIAAPPLAVWRQIVRVPPIHEPVSGFFYTLGFPKPIEATLSKEGVGGIRHASFSGGLVFIETIDRWKEGELLSFSIKSDPESVPATTLDKHVVVGGRYFDVLRGTYQIEPLPAGGTRLHLSSNFRVSTRFNFYANFLAHLLMRDVQESILRVIKGRCEANGTTARSSM